MDNSIFSAKTYALRLVRLIFGLFLYALGMVVTVQANVGLAAWESFSAGVSNVTGIAFGMVVTLTGVVILAFVLFLKEKIGIGTICNTILIGVFIDILRDIDFIPLCENMFLGVLMLLFGQLLVCLASFFYIGSGFGCGPRDSLMVALARKLPKLPIGAIRGVIEATVLLVGILLGAKAGVGTVIGVFGISFLLQGTFRVLKFDVKTVTHESLIDSWKLLQSAFKKRKEKEKETV